MEKCRNQLCGLEHPRHVRCDAWARMLKANGETPLDQPAVPVASEDVGVDRPERRPKAIKEAEAFIRRVGRPKVYADRKTQMRELMRRKRAAERAR